jgi:beta-xylosidase
MPSLRGEMYEAANELRDPFVFRDKDGRLYLYYVGGGEKAIGIARLIRR